MNLVQRIDLFSFNNMGTLTRFGSMCYFVIEGFAVGIAQYYITDAETGAVTLPEWLELSGLVIEIAKIVYITWIEFIFGAVFYMTVKKQLANGWDLGDIMPITVSFLLVALTTLAIFVMGCVNMGIMDLASPFNGTPLDGKKLTMMLLIPLSLIVNVLIIFIDDKNGATASMFSAPAAATPAPSTAPPSTPAPAPVPPANPNPAPANSTPPPASTPSTNTPAPTLLKQEWIDNPSSTNIMALVQRLSSTNPNNPFNYDRNVINSLSDQDAKKIMDFIQQGSDITEQTRRAFIALASSLIIDDTDHLRNNAALAAEWGN